MSKTMEDNAQSLFPDLPKFPPSLSDEELRFLASLPEWTTVIEVDWDDEAVARRLERCGLIKVHRWKSDPCAIRARMYAGRTATAGIRLVNATRALSEGEQG